MNRHSQKDKEGDRENWIVEIAFFLTWPFASLIRALRNYKSWRAKVFAWLFCVYFGFVFLYDEPSLRIGSDSARYAIWLINFHDLHPSLSRIVGDMYRLGGAYVDIYQPVVTWFVSKFTNDPRVLFAVFGGVFGYFYVQNLWIVFSFVSKKVGWALFLLMLGYALVDPIWYINGARMWTATQIFLYGALLYFVRSEVKGLVWCGLSALVHFSFAISFLLLLGFLLLPKRTSLFVGLFFLTAFLLEARNWEVSTYASYVPRVFQERLSPYLSSRYIELVRMQRSQLALHVKLADGAIRWFTYLWILAIYLRGRGMRVKLPGVNNLFLLGLLIGSFANVFEGLPSGGRFLVVANYLLFAVFTIVMGQEGLAFRDSMLQMLALPLLMYWIVFSIRIGLDYMGMMVILGNPFVAVLVGKEIPLINLIKAFLFG